MKKLLFAFLLLSSSYGLLAQAGSGFGIKAGLNYSGNGDYFDAVRDASENPERNAGFHIGVFGKLGTQIYVRPELMYTRTTSGYNQGDLKIQKIDMPLLVGTKVFGPLHAFLGPSFQYILDTSFDGVSIDDIENDITLGFHFGVGVNLAKFGIDLRYERGFSENEIRFINSNIVNINDRVDTRPDQLIVSVSIKL
ncbi:MAG: outer membrane beta-barrel protein [Bacteroidota bacterium]